MRARVYVRWPRTLQTNVVRGRCRQATLPRLLYVQPTPNGAMTTEADRHHLHTGFRQDLVLVPSNCDCLVSLATGVDDPLNATSSAEIHPSFFLRPADTTTEAAADRHSQLSNGSNLPGSASAAITDWHSETSIASVAGAPGLEATATLSPVQSATQVVITSRASTRRRQVNVVGLGTFDSSRKTRRLWSAISALLWQNHFFSLVPHTSSAVVDF